MDEANPVPPLGVAPREVWQAAAEAQLNEHERQLRAERMAEINRAVQRYTQARMPVPQAWLDEYRELADLSSRPV